MNEVGKSAEVVKRLTPTNDPMKSRVHLSRTVIRVSEVSVGAAWCALLSVNSPLPLTIAGNIWFLHFEEHDVYQHAPTQC